VTQIVHSLLGARIRGKSTVDDFYLNTVRSDELVGDVLTGTQTIRDITYNTAVPQTTIRKSNVEVNSIPQISPIYESATPDVCSVNQQGIVTRVSDGTCGILVHANRDTRRIDSNITTVPGTLAYTGVLSFGSNSLRKYLWDQQLACFSGLTPGAGSQAAFDNTVVNANCLVRRTVAGYQRPPLDALDQLLVGTGGPASNFHPWRAWITPHHYLTWAGHFPNTTPTATTRTIAELRVVYSATPWNGSLCKFLPANAGDTKLPPVSGVANTIGSYIAAWARLRNVYVAGQSYWVQPVNLGSINPVPVSDPRRPWQRLSSTGVMATSGDSGSPIWTQINGDLVILNHVVMYGLAGGGGLGQSPYNMLLNQINTALGELNSSGLYTAQTVDLSGFSNF
jgi:hypothetical protein